MDRDAYRLHVATFFAFCRLVLARKLAVVRDASGGHFLPSEMHPLADDCLALGA